MTFINVSTLAFAIFNKGLDYTIDRSGLSLVVVEGLP